MALAIEKSKFDMKFEEIRTPLDVNTYVAEYAIGKEIASCVRGLVYSVLYEANLFHSENQTFNRLFCLGNATKIRAHDKEEVITGPCFIFSVGPTWEMAVILKIDNEKIVDAELANRNEVRYNLPT